jgi:pyruvate-formate lyase
VREFARPEFIQGENHDRGQPAGHPGSQAAALSAQELAIEGGSRALHGNLSERVLRLFDAIRGDGGPRLALDRSRYFTESFRETEGQPLPPRWAKALRQVCEHLPVAIFDDEMIVGRPSTWLGRYGLVYGELDGSLLEAAAEAEARPGHRRELEQIAAASAHVPEHPARNFHEALQAQGFAQLFSRLEQNIGGQVSQGRMDQYLYPFHRRAVDAGRLTPEAAQELLQCVWFNMMQSPELKMSPSAAASMEGCAHMAR